MKRNQRKTIAEWIAEITPEEFENIQAILNRGALQSLTESDIGCYDAVIQSHDGEPLCIEVNLNASGGVEDLHCSCNIGFCTHLAAVLYEINAGHVSSSCETRFEVSQLFC